MTAPGGPFGESGHDEADGGGAPEQRDHAAPWEPPAPPPGAGSVPPAYPPPGYSADYASGYGPPGYPGGYYPSEYHGGYAGSVQPGTNPLAIASLIASLTGLVCGLGAIVAMVLGVIALDQIRRTRQEGFGMAVAGIVIGIATLVVIFVVVLFTLHSH